MLGRHSQQCIADKQELSKNINSKCSSIERNIIKINRWIYEKKYIVKICG
jgi:hypothetical protein